ncbi:hypothetical protein F4782DRAFT_495980 [Xylaria castorea]|nr:hypothetical protein F4782DRAFT_495980 [Xylaria castorea]
MMSHKSQNFEILCDSRSTAGNQPPRDRRELVSPQSQSQPLRHLSTSQSQNRQLENDSVDTGIQRIHELRRVSCNPHRGAIQKNEKRVGGRLTRPSITSDTFEVLSTVAELESQTQNVPAASKISDDAQRILQLPVDRYSSHPLSIAALNIPPLEKQLAKHCDGWFEWILAVTPPSNFKSQRDNGSGVRDSTEVRKVYFGCNLLPELSLRNNGALKTAHPANSYSLLVTSLEATKEVLEVFRGPVYEPGMALPEENLGHSTPVKTSGYASLRGVDEKTPTSTICTRGDDTSPPSMIDSSLGDHFTRIEDSFEALDILEDQLEAFDEDARFSQFIPTEKPHSLKEPLARTEIATPSLSVRFATPQPQRTFTKPSSASFRVKAASEPRRATLRKVTSMTLDSPKFRAEEKNLIQFSPLSTNKPTRSSLRRPVARSTKKPTIPTFELPGEAVARQLKEKKEARLASQRATRPTAASLRRAKSAKLPAGPTFELPGEAISRRKREEHQAQLKTQEEEERKRRTFRARPVPSYVAPTTVPRETIASRARQNTATLTENSVRGSTPNRRPFITIGSHSRPALSSTINQVQHRGRGSKAEKSAFLQTSRATSTSTNSLSGKRSSLSIEDVHMQKLRGHEIYQRDNSWTDTRMREKCEREALAKLAREEAAEKSRQKSRDWAAKQAKKRMTVGSLQDVIM